ncbi:MAG: ATPase [Candidatus Pelagibacter sp.]|tara:strand:+ start:91 stop:588 length:498 start_codon:yes stop_codon:yes gene_type:complete
MELDSTFWVAVSFVIFILVLVYFKIPQTVNNLLSKMIGDISNEIDESEKLRSESRQMLEQAQKKLSTAKDESKKILEAAKEDADKLIIEMNDRFFKSSEVKKNNAQKKITQMKEMALKEIRDTSVKLAIESVKKAINTSIDKSKLDELFKKNLEDTKSELKKIIT